MAVIVAGLGGIGNGLARRYADEGGRLVIGDLDSAAPDDVARAVEQAMRRVPVERWPVGVWA